MGVLEPEVEQVAHDVELGRIPDERGQELVKRALAGRLSLVRLGAQMSIRKEVGGRAGRHEAQSIGGLGGRSSRGPLVRGRLWPRWSAAQEPPARTPRIME